MAGQQFVTVASAPERRIHELAANRAVSLDAGGGALIKLAPASAQPEEMANGGPPKSKSASPPQASNYFRPAHSEIRFGKMRFLVTDRPSERNIDSYVADLRRAGATTLIRVCEPTYDAAFLKACGIDVRDWEFVDGSPPPAELIAKWLQLCADVFLVPDQCIAIHCVAGLGRAPVMVVIALMEAGMKCEDAILLIRNQRRGALNDKQVQFLRSYRSTYKLRKFRYASISKQRKSCTVM